MTATQESYSDRAKALQDMPNIVGTPGTGAYQRSLERLLGWYDEHFRTIRASLQVLDGNTLPELPYDWHYISMSSHIFESGPYWRIGIGSGYYGEFGYETQIEGDGKTPREAAEAAIREIK